jgi:hypothetical protein
MTYPQKSAKSFQKRWKRKRLFSLINEGIMVKLRAKEIHTLQQFFRSHIKRLV